MTDRREAKARKATRMTIKKQTLRDLDAPQGKAREIKGGAKTTECETNPCPRSNITTCYY